VSALFGPPLADECHYANTKTTAKTPSVKKRARGNMNKK
jgi:hypothetical protein